MPPKPRSHRETGRHAARTNALPNLLTDALHRLHHGTIIRGTYPATTTTTPDPYGQALQLANQQAGKTLYVNTLTKKRPPRWYRTAVFATQLTLLFTASAVITTLTYTIIKILQHLT